MSKYKWCVCDMDGTLLNSQSSISPENEIALKKLQENGTEVIIASGRTDHLLKSYIKQLGLTGSIICCNGGLVKNIKTDKILYSKLLDKMSVEDILNSCFQNKLNFLIYTVHKVYSNQGNPLGIRYENLNRSLQGKLKIPIEFVDNQILSVIDSMDILKILLVCRDKDEVNLLQDHFSANEKLTVVSSADKLLDIMASDISKGNALKILSRELNVDLKQVIAFGDNYNDIDMLSSVGMSIAMGNAVDDVKKVAKCVTKSNNESGIAYAIYNLI